jgi:hypothetical protein
MIMSKTKFNYNFNIVFVEASKLFTHKFSFRRQLCHIKAFKRMHILVLLFRPYRFAFIFLVSSYELWLLEKKDCQILKNI